MNVVLVMFKDKERREFPVPEAGVILGRRQDCHLRIPTRDVSRKHCELFSETGNLVVKDLGSSNGTYVNGKRVAKIKLKAGDRLRVGPVTFVVQIDGQPADIKPEDTAPPTTITPTAGPAGDEETFDLSEADFDLDDPISSLEKPKDDEDNLP